MEDLERIAWRDNMGTCTRCIKRFLDFIASIIGMLVFSPLFLLIYIAIKWEDSGPAIFRQERVGYHGKTFVIKKFRTMIVGAESDGRPVLCQKSDARLTKIGRFLREHHLDELPQLWNVFVGEMSFVGPRPERKFYIDKIMEVNPDYELLYQVRPGLFSMATLYNGYTDTLEKMLVRLQMDLDYLEKHSLWMDTKIIVLTALTIILGKKI